MDFEQARTETNKTIVELLATTYSNTAFIERKEAIMTEVVDTVTEAHPAPLIALAMTKIMLGKAEEASEVANRIWEMGGKISNILESLFIFQLNSLGLFSRSLVLLKPKISLYASARAENPRFKEDVLRCAIGLGDIDMLGKIAKLEEFSKEKPIIDDFISLIDKGFFRQHFKIQQESINNIITGKQAAFEVKFNMEQGYPILGVAYFVGGDSVDRYQLQNKIEEDYANYYLENQINPISNFTFSIFDIKDHWALEE